MAEHLNVNGYGDTMLWGKDEESSNNGELEKKGLFPITRYENILNRPKVIKENETLSESANANFLMVITEVEEVPDDIVFDLFKQVW